LSVVVKKKVLLFTVRMRGFIIKLFMCVNKHKGMMGVWENGGIAPCILNLATDDATATLLQGERPKDPSAHYVGHRAALDTIGPKFSGVHWTTNQADKSPALMVVAAVVVVAELDY
jgi:hypothetical protein